MKSETKKALWEKISNPFVFIPLAIGVIIGLIFLLRGLSGLLEEIEAMPISVRVLMAAVFTFLYFAWRRPEDTLHFLGQVWLYTMNSVLKWLVISIFITLPATLFIGHYFEVSATSVVQDLMEAVKTLRGE